MSPKARQKRSERRLYVRESAASQRDLTTRTLSVRAATIDEKARTVEAVLSTERQALVWDWKSWSEVEEVLRADGAEIPSQIPLLETHNRWTLDAVFGSIRDIRVEKDQIVGRLHFAEGDDAASRAWNKVRQGHLTDVSVGYQVREFTDIPPGESRAIGGKTYSAKGRTLRVTTGWSLREGSLVPIGADPAAKIREPQTVPIRASEIAMPPKVRQYLTTLGLRADASDAEAQTFLDGLSGAQRQQADAIRAEATPPAQPPATQPERAASDPPAAPTQPQPSLDAIRAEAAAAERGRIIRLRELAGGDVPQETVEQAIREGWDEARASSAYLAAIRAARAPAVGPGAPSIHSRSHESQCTRAALSAAMLMRSGLDPVAQMRTYRDGCYMPRRDAQPNPELVRAAEAGWQFRDMSLVELCRECCRIDGINIPSSRGEMIRAAISTMSLTNIFTTNVGAQLLAGWEDAADSTVGWVSEADVENFLTQERAAMGKFGALTKHAKGGTANDLDVADTKEEYKIARYSGKFTVDEIDIINDRFGAIEQLSPRDIGATARQLRPNLVYAILLANAALDADSGTLFNSTAETTAGGHANLTTAALAAAALQAGIVAMAKHRIRSRPLNIRPRFLIVPQDLIFTAQILLTSAERVIASDSGGTYNPLKDFGITPVADDRIGAAGVTDPNTGTASTGLATNWFLAARPGENGAKTIEVGYLRGTGRAPQLRNYVLTEGQWGLGWDVNIDLGAKALDFRGLHKSTGAA